MPDHDWDEHYARGEMPWDMDEPDPHLVEIVRSHKLTGRALDVGSGTGTHALWLAQEGFDVVGVDIASGAVERANAKLGERGARCRFEVADFLAGGAPSGPFDFVFDRGCFHVFDAADARDRFVREVAARLAPGGLWLSLVGSTEGPARHHGPPRRSARDVVSAIEPHLELAELRAIAFDVGQPHAARAWLCLARKRAMPAQPSTGG